MRIVYLDFGYPDMDLEQALAGEAGLTLTAASPRCATPDDVIRAGAGAEALVVTAVEVTRPAIEALPDLRILSVPGIGVDMIDVDAARDHGVWVAHVPDGNITEVAAHALAMALALIRHLPWYDRDVRAGIWDFSATGPLRRPGLLTFGLIGLGRIGRLTAAYAAPLFGSVVACDPFVPDAAWPAEIERAASPAELIARSDVVSLHMPLTAENRGLVDAAFLAAMKPGSYLVNVSRGPLVDTAALIDALDSGHLAGAALDVTPQEPPDPDDPLLRHPGVLLSPHAAFYSLEADEELRRRAITNIVEFARTGRPSHVVVEGTR